MKDTEVIARQAVEIIELKDQISDLKGRIRDAYGYANSVQQWSPKCPDFPSLAMKNVIQIAEICNEQ